MVELVDTQDLKSCSRKRSAGSIPALSTKPGMKISGFVVSIIKEAFAKFSNLLNIPDQPYEQSFIFLFYDNHSFTNWL